MRQNFRFAANLFLVSVSTLALAMLCSAPAFAQRGAAGGHGAISAHSHQVLSSSAVARPVVRHAPANMGTRQLNGVRGLGFDYQHLAAVHRNAREPRFRHRVVGPVFLGGYPYVYPYDYGDDSAYTAPAGQQYGDQYSDPNDDQHADQGGDQYADQAPTRRPAAALQLNATPEREIENFALVLKDGSQISAVAFTRQGDQVVYINNDGKRQYVAVAQVDAGATTKVNEDRGTPLKFSL